MLVSAHDDDPHLSDHLHQVDTTRELLNEPVPPHAPAAEVRSVRDRLRTALEEGGLPQLLRLGLNRVTAPWAEFGSVTFFRRRLDRPEVPRDRAGLSILQATLADVDLVLETSDPRRTPEIVRERLARGDLCYLSLTTAGRPCHSGWATRLGARVPELERHVVLRPDEAYLYDAFTPPSQRGHGAFGFVLDHLFAELRARGARVVYSYVRSDDPKGQRAACVRLRPVGTVFNIRLRGRTPVVFGASTRALPTLVRHLVDDEGRALR